MCFERLVSFVPEIQRELLYPATCTQLGGSRPGTSVFFVLYYTVLYALAYVFQLSKTTYNAKLTYKYGIEGQEDGGTGLCCLQRFLRRVGDIMILPRNTLYHAHNTYVLSRMFSILKNIKTPPLGGRKHLPYPKPENPDMSKPRELQRLPGVDPHALYSLASDMQKSSERGVKGDGRGTVL